METHRCWGIHVGLIDYCGKLRCCINFPNDYLLSDSSRKEVGPHGERENISVPSGFDWVHREDVYKYFQMYFCSAMWSVERTLNMY